MLTLLKNADCYCPSHIGIRNILIAANKIYKITTPGEINDSALIENTIDCGGLYAFPGLIDQHVHITGGGGEEGFASRAPELELGEITGAGVSTIVGLLGADGCTRSMESLYAKAKALEAQGLTTYIYSGSYSVPQVTLTGSLMKDIVIVDKVVGAGEIAIADHRSAQPDVSALLKLSADAHLGGLLSGKAGVVHLHIGEGKEGLGLLLRMVKESDLPMDMFVPTHVNRSVPLFWQAVEYCRAGGNIDLTAGETAGVSVPEAVSIFKKEGINMTKVTVSSDAGGSIPGGGISKVEALYSDLMEIIKQSVLPPEEALRLATENVAKILKLYPAKGALSEGSDADIFMTDKNYRLMMLFSGGKLLVNKDVSRRCK